jgi:hypothetical protein
MTDYTTTLVITGPGGQVLNLSGTLSDGAPTEPPTEPPVDPPTDGITDRTYDPHSGTWGQPGSGNNWTAVFQKMVAQILADQAAAGDGKLNAVIPLRKGSTYNYTDNRWTCGIQSFDVKATGSGTVRPRLCCNTSTHSYDLDAAILQAGGGTFLDFYTVGGGKDKQWQARIENAVPGDTSVTIRSGSTTSHLRVGRWHLVCSYDQQAGGGPPNCRYFDWVKVTDISGTTVTLDRPVQHSHRTDYWERYPQDGLSFGEARIMPMDVGGSAGVMPSTNVRLTGKQTWTGIEFVANPNYPTSANMLGTFIYMSGVALTFTDCVMPYPVPSISKDVRFVNCSLPLRCETDKLTESVTFDNTTIGGDGIGSSTGINLLEFKDSKVAPGNPSPRHFKATNTVFDVNLGPPPDVNSYLLWAGVPGPINLMEHIGCTFSAENQHTSGQVMPIGDRTVRSYAIGGEVRWNGNTLICDVDTPAFEWFLGMADYGSVVYAGTEDNLEDYTSWGVVTALSSSGDGRQAWFIIDWKAGTRPTSGRLAMSRVIEISIDDASKLGNSATRWDNSGGAMQQRLPEGWGPSYDFPAGYN